MSPADLVPLARIAHEMAAEWGLELGEPFALSNYSYVAPAGEDAVLKVTPADDDEADEELDALVLWDGHGAVRLLRHDRARRALLLERARPGTDIAGLPERAATAIAVGVAAQLWRPAGEPFRWIGDHVPRWLDQAERSDQEGRDLIPLARELYATLDVGRDVLVHGDFHHHNILRAGDRHLAIEGHLVIDRHLVIDPKAMLGEPEFDVPSFLRNPLHYTMRDDVTAERLRAFADAGLDEERMRMWAVIRCAYLGADPDEERVLRSLV